LAQDPYLHAEEAMGLCFSVPKTTKIPPSLRNIFTEIKSDLKKPDYEFRSGDLTEWGQQGILLINSILTVREGDSASHAKSGWQQYTDNVFKLLNTIERPIVYMMWGAFAQSKGKYITNPRHLKLVSGHPSPLSCKKFFGNHHFTQANEFLIKKGIEPIRWLL
jgi:uracil-DNA glycosylase